MKREGRPYDAYERPAVMRTHFDSTVKNDFKPMSQDGDHRNFRRHYEKVQRINSNAVVN